MRALYSIFFSVVFLSAIVLGCSASVDSKSIAKEVVTQYKGQLYNITDYNKFDVIVGQNEKLTSYIEDFKDYMTEKGHERFGANRIRATPLQACNKGKFFLKMTNIEFNTIKEEDDKIIMEYTLILDAVNVETGSNTTSDETGEIILIKENNAWKIDHNRFEVADLIEQELGMKKGAVIKF